MDKYRYHYTIFTNGQDYWDFMLNDLKLIEDIEVIANPLEYNNCPKLLQLLYRIHFNGRLNSIIEIPNKKYWNKWYYGAPKTNKPICFIFMMTWLNPIYKPFFVYLRKKFSSSKIIVYLEDVILSRPKGAISYDILKNYVDFVISYDKDEAKRNGFFYYPTFISKFVLPNNPDLKINDLFFCGAAKNRYEKIIEMYKKIKDIGLSIDCSIARVSPQEKRYLKDDITYIDYVWPYSKYLEHLNASKCIVELMQPNACGFTLRTWEALMFDKKMITTNKEIESVPFYSPEQFLYTENFEDSEIRHFLNLPFSPISDSEKDSLSPVKFIDFIENIVLA